VYPQAKDTLKALDSASNTLAEAVAGAPPEVKEEEEEEEEEEEGGSSEVQGALAAAERAFDEVRDCHRAVQDYGKAPVLRLCVACQSSDSQLSFC
jgi:hypothetical protein